MGGGSILEVLSGDASRKLVLRRTVQAGFHARPDFRSVHHSVDRS